MTDTGDDGHERKNGKKSRPKSQWQEMMNDEAAKCQAHQSCQRLALKLPVVHD
jgi:hypothetical protein